jgi:hypothetical protein
MALFGSKNTTLALLAASARAGTTKSSTDTAYGTGNEVIDLTKAGPIKAIAFELNCSVQAKDVGDTLDVYVQTSLDGGTTWVDVVHFTQLLGNTGGAKVYYAKIAAVTALTMFETAAALTAGNVRDLIGTHLRAKYVITNDSDDPIDTTFTFGLIAVAM